MVMIMSGRQQLVSEAKKGSREGVRHFLDKGVSPDARDDDGTTALFWASCRGYPAVCRLLVFHGADVNGMAAKTGATSLMGSADNNQLSCMEELLRDRKTDVDKSCHTGDTALHMGAYRGYTRVLHLLIRHGADPFIVNRYRRTALDEAQAQSHTECLDILRHYMVAYKPSLSIATRLSGNSERLKAIPQRSPDEDGWPAPKETAEDADKGPDITTGRGPPTKHADGTATLYTSIESRDSAIVVSPPNSLQWNLSNDNSLSYVKQPCHYADNAHGSSVHGALVKSPNMGIHERSLGYGDSLNSFIDCNSKEESVSENPHDYKSLRPSFYPVSVDSQYDSFSSNHNNLLDTATSLTSMKASNASLQSGSDSPSSFNGQRIDKDATRRYDDVGGSQHCSKRVNNLSFKRLPVSDNDTSTSDLLPLEKQSLGLNILPSANTRPQLDHAPKRNTWSGTSDETTSFRDKLEVISGVQLSEFIENLQLQLLQNQNELHQEKQQNFDLKQRIMTLSDENAKLKSTINGLCQAIYQKR